MIRPFLIRLWHPQVEEPLLPTARARLWKHLVPEGRCSKPSGCFFDFLHSTQPAGAKAIRETKICCECNKKPDFSSVRGKVQCNPPAFPAKNSPILPHN